MFSDLHTVNPRSSYVDRCGHNFIAFPREKLVRIFKEDFIRNLENAGLGLWL